MRSARTRERASPASRSEQWSCGSYTSSSRGWLSPVSERYYSALLSFLGGQFGASDDRTFHARGGMAAAEFEAGVHLWTHDGVSLVLEQFAGKIDRSLLTYGSAPAMADLVRSKTSYPRGAHRDL